MHSIKNTVVAVVLLGASYGIYNVLTTPDPTLNDTVSIEAGENLLGTIGYSSDMTGGSGTSGLNAPMADGSATNLIPPIAPAALPQTQFNSSPAAPTAPPASSFQAQSFEPVTPSSAQRDQGLMDALGNQIGAARAAGNRVQESIDNGFDAAKANLSNAANQFGSQAAQAKENVAQALQDSFQNNFAATQPAPAPSESFQPESFQPESFQSQPSGSNDFAITPAEIPVKAAPTPDRPNNDFSSYPAQRVPTNVDNNQTGQFQLASASAAPKAATPSPTATLNATWPQVNQMVESGNFRGALGTLSKFYGEPSLSAADQQKLAGWLDGLAGKVIYSPENTLFAKPYVVQANESLTDIATRWGVPAQLIYNVNRAKIPNPALLAPGTEIKMVTGPFNGQLDLSDSTMTLYWKNLYAGRFNVSLGSMGDLVPGDYRVITKRSEGHPYRDIQEQVHPIGAPGNGYGPNWIGMDRGLCIHAVNANTTSGHPGCIGLSTKDSADMFGILSENSTITIVR